MKRYLLRGLTAVAPLSFVFAACVAQAEFFNYYVGLDTSPSEPNWSAYRDQDGDGVADTDMANPNLGRLTLLYAHYIEDDASMNHFHAIGRYAYEGQPDAPTISPENQFSFWFGGELFSGVPGNLIPEQFSDFGSETVQLTLEPTSGPVYDGKLTSIPNGESGATYAKTTIRPYAELLTHADGTPQHYMATSPTQYDEQYDASLDGAVIGIELIDITPGLKIGSLEETNVLEETYDRVVIGQGDELFSFTPVFWTEADAPLGDYHATMRLVDMSTSGTALMPSGQYTFTFTVVPEPSTAILGAVAFAGLAVRRRNG